MATFSVPEFVPPAFSVSAPASTRSVPVLFTSHLIVFAAVVASVFGRLSSVPALTLYGFSMAPVRAGYSITPSQ